MSKRARLEHWRAEDSSSMEETVEYDHAICAVGAIPESDVIVTTC
jgi:hypothetical protein